MRLVKADMSSKVTAGPEIDFYSEAKEFFEKNGNLNEAKKM